jgi:hypothetical protein
MNPEKHSTEYLKKLESMKLSDSSRARIETNLKAYAQFHAANEGVRVAEASRSNEQVSSHTKRHASLFSNKFMYMPFVIVFAVLVGGGTSLAAQRAVPGDFLYSIKTEINEPVRSAFAVGANAEADLQAKLVAERIKEAEELESEGKFESKTAAKLAANIQAHVAKADKAMKKSNPEVRTKTASNLNAALGRFNSLVGNDTGLAIGIPAAYSEGSIDTSLSSTLATRVMDVATFRTMTETRVEDLVSVVEKSESELSAEVYVSLIAKLDEATELLVESQTQAEVEARATIDKASELAGDVESKLTTLGTAKIDAQTGAIIEIDFSNIPPLELNIGEDGRVVGEESDPKMNRGEVDIEGGVDVNLDTVEIDINEATRSEIRL